MPSSGVTPGAAGAHGSRRQSCFRSPFGAQSSCAARAREQDLRADNSASDPYVDEQAGSEDLDLQIPKSNCTEDIAMPPGEFAWTPRSRLGLCRFLQMPGGHEACFTNPALLAEKIVEAARD